MRCRQVTGSAPARQFLARVETKQAPTAPTRTARRRCWCDVAEAECPSCRRLFGARCGVAPSHAGVTCAECGRLGKGDRRKEDLLLLEMAKGRKWKRCPKCEYFVEKREGCLHITCRRGFEFCYGCGGK